ncbi:MAG: ribonuclease III [Clostridia bacterium]|nr:ribonuclease III [Clostridia bacterium]
MNTRAADRFPHGQMPGSLELAFVGDSVYDLYVRTMITATGGKIRDLHKKAVTLVNAHAQSEALIRIEDELTEEEEAIVRRARNTRQSPPKNADASEYHRATALEALLGYLYLTEQRERLEFFLKRLTDIGG